MDGRVARVLVMAITLALSALFFRSPYDFKKGEVVPRTIIAEKRVVVEKDRQAYVQESLRIISEVPPVYKRLPYMDRLSRIYDSLSAIIGAAKAKEFRERAISHLQKGVISPKIYGDILVYENDRFKRVPGSIFRSPAEICQINDTLCSFIFPTLVPDTSLRNAYLKSVLEKKLSRIEQVINPGDIVASKGEVVTEKTYRILKAYSRATAKPKRISYVFLCLLMALAVVSIFYSRKWDVPSWASVFLFSVSHLGEIALHYFFDLQPFITLMPFVAMSVSVLDTPTMGVGLTLITSVIRGVSYDFSLLLPLYVGSMSAAAAFSVKFFKRRYHYVPIALLIAFFGSISVLISTPFVMLTQRDIVWSVVITSAISIISVGLYAMVLPFVEVVFKKTTELSYIELASLNHPLLKDLAEKAPGTFAHSIIVGNMAEAAARAVGANDVVAKLGGYYHDIGKLFNPEYFIENQAEGENPHDGLDPVKSAQIIISHVKKGVELAKRYRLPQEIIDIIRTHHGDTLLWPFYKKALDMGLNVSEKQFRYPGPRPRTPEEAIVMLADSSEAASRSAPTEEEIKAIIERVFEQRVKEGQLDLVPLSKRDLERIKATFIPIILTFRHQRPKYPSPDE